MLNNKLIFRPLIYVAMIMLISANAFALKMGTMQVRSHLGEPLDVRIQLSDLNTINISDVTVKLAAADQYEQNNLEYLVNADNVKISINPIDSELAVVSVKTLVAISEQSIHLLFDVQGGDESFLSRYTVILGQPIVSISSVLAEPVLTQVATDSVGLINDASPQKITNLINNKIYRVKDGETLSAIAKKFRPAEVVPVRAWWAIYRLNPNSFKNGDINHLLKGTIIIPTRSQMLEISTAEATANFHNNVRLSKIASSKSALQPQSVIITSTAPVSTDLGQKFESINELQQNNQATAQALSANVGEEDKTTNESRPKSEQELRLKAQLDKMTNRLTRQTLNSASLEKKVAAFQGQVEQLNREQKAAEKNALTAALVAQNRVERAEEKISKMSEEMKNSRVSLDQVSLGVNINDKNNSQIVKSSIDSKNDDIEKKVQPTTKKEDITPGTNEANIADSLPPVEKGIENYSVADNQVNDGERRNLIQIFQEKLANFVAYLATGNGRLMGVLGAILLGILLMLVFLRPRKINDDAVATKDDSVLKRETRASVVNEIDLELVSSNTMYDDESANRYIDGSSKRTKSANAASKPKRKTKVHQRPVTELSAVFSKQEISSSDEVIAEAEVYLAYNRLQRAINVLKRSLKVSPNQVVVAYKLLGIYKDYDDKDSFRLLFDDSIKHFSKDKKWDEVKQLAEEFLPEHPLFSDED